MRVLDNILDPATGDEEPLVRNESGYPFNPAYSPNGKKIAVYWNRVPRAGLWVISLVDNSETLLRAGRRARPAGWSPDGSSLYAYAGTDMLSIPVEPSGRDAPHTILTAPGDIASASVSADGKKLVYSAAEKKSDVWVVNKFDPANRK
jgi:Tol biopolymer transport system component